MNDRTVKGRVLRVFEDMQYGYIFGDDRRRYLFHKSNLMNIHMEQLTEKSEVIFNGFDDGCGDRARLIQYLGEED